MKEISINFDLPDAQYNAGYIGEHGAVSLAIDLSSFTEDSASYYLARFENSYGDIFVSRHFSADEIIDDLLKITLWSEITSTGKVSFCCECWSESDNKVKLIKKSPIINLLFENSVNGLSKELSDNHDSILTDLEKIKTECFDICENAATDIENNVKASVSSSIKARWTVVKDFVLDENCESFTVDDFSVNGEFLIRIIFVGCLDNEANATPTVSINDNTLYFLFSMSLYADEDNDVYILGSTEPYMRGNIIRNNAASNYQNAFESTESLTSLYFRLIQGDKKYNKGTKVVVYKKEYCIDEK